MNDYIRHDILISKEDLMCKKLKDLVPVKCGYCNKLFHRTKRNILNDAIRRGANIYCSRACGRLKRYTPSRIPVFCKNCNKPFVMKLSQFNKSPNHFCSRSCSGYYNNTHKQYGTRRSKLELYLETELKTLYPNIDFKFNHKDAINSELDIYIPSLKLAFELNGIFHYEPIYGPERLSKIQNNDSRKFQACHENQIELCIIDSSSQKHFKESKSQKYLDIIKSIINTKLAEDGVLETHSFEGAVGFPNQVKCLFDSSSIK